MSSSPAPCVTRLHLTLVCAGIPPIPGMTRSGIASSKLFGLFLDAKGFWGMLRSLIISFPLLWTYTHARVVCLFYFQVTTWKFGFSVPWRALLSPSHADSEEIDRKRARVKNSEGGDVPQKYFVVTNNQLLRVKYLLVYSQKQHRR